MSKLARPKDAATGAELAQEARLRKRHRAEKRFRLYGLTAIGLALLSLTVLFAGIAVRGAGAFVRSIAEVEVYFDPALIDPKGEASAGALGAGDYGGLVKQTLRELFPDVSVDDPQYRTGFRDGHVAPRDAPEPRDKSRAYLAGWLDSRERSAVPQWRLEAS